MLRTVWMLAEAVYVFVYSRGRAEYPVLLVAMLLRWAR